MGIESSCEVAFFRAVQSRSGHGDRFKREARGIGVTNQMNSIEQQARAGWIRRLGERAKRLHDRIVTTRDRFHRLSVCYSLHSHVKERILKRCTDELAALERELKFELPQEIKRARELGDLRENAEYKAAKERQEIVNARIAMLKKRMGEISLMNLDRVPKGRAGFGSTVHLRGANGDLVTYQLVMPEEADFEKGLISTSSPIGRAILNKEEGDQIKVTTPGGTRQFELVKLITIHDAATH